MQYDVMYKKSVEDPDAFWGDVASTFYWKTKWSTKDGQLHSENLDVRKGPVSIEVCLRKIPYKWCHPRS